MNCQDMTGLSGMEYRKNTANKVHCDRAQGLSQPLTSLRGSYDQVRSKHKRHFTLYDIKRSL